MQTEKIKLHFCYDGGHGWLRLPITLVDQLDIATNISRFSYINSDYVFLEEDCDASLAIKALEEKNITYAVDHVDHGNRSTIRNYN